MWCLRKCSFYERSCGLWVRQPMLKRENTAQFLLRSRQEQSAAFLCIVYLSSRLWEGKITPASFPRAVPEPKEVLRPLEAAAAKSLQLCPTLCGPIDSSPPGFPVPGILQARTLDWVAISVSNAWKWKVKVKLLSHVWPSVTSWTAAFQAPPSMGFSRQEYWSGVPSKC